MATTNIRALSLPIAVVLAVITFPACDGASPDGHNDAVDGDPACTPPQHAPDGGPTTESAHICPAHDAGTPPASQPDLAQLAPCVVPAAMGGTWTECTGGPGWEVRSCTFVAVPTAKGCVFSCPGYFGCLASTASMKDGEFECITHAGPLNGGVDLTATCKR